MFYDERIEKTKGKIIRNAIIISVITSALSLMFSLFGYMIRKSFYIVVADIIVVTAGGVCLLVDIIRNKIRVVDERVVFEQSEYYKSVFKIVMFVFPLAYAVFTPLSQIKNQFTPFFSDTAMLLFLFVGMYVMCSFKKNNIYFNYSVIESKHYCKYVFKNVAKLFVWLFLLFIISIISIVVYSIAKNENGIINKIFILRIAMSYSIVLFLITVLYLFLSIVEKISYKNIGYTYKPTLFLLAFTCVLLVMFILFLIFAYIPHSFISFRDWTYEFAYELPMYLFYFGTYFLLAVSVCYFKYEYNKGNCTSRCMSIVCNVIIINEMLNMLFYVACNWINGIYGVWGIEPLASVLHLIVKFLYDFMSYGAGAIRIICFIAVLLLLIHEKYMKRISVVISVLVTGKAIEIIIGKVNAILIEPWKTFISSFNVVSMLVYIFMLFYLGFVVIYISKRKKIEEMSNDEIHC